jgi:hypothetical protein
MISSKLPIAIPVALALGLAGCGGAGKAAPRASTPQAAGHAVARSDSRVISDTLREFRRRYESKDPTACDLVTSTFKPTTGGKPAGCKSAVEAHRFSYAVFALRSEGNRIGPRSAAILSVLRRDDGTSAKHVDGRVRLRKEGSQWRISSIRPG